MQNKSLFSHSYFPLSYIQRIWAYIFIPVCFPFISNSFPHPLICRIKNRNWILLPLSCTFQQGMPVPGHGCPDWASHMILQQEEYAECEHQSDHLLMKIIPKEKLTCDKKFGTFPSWAHFWKLSKGSQHSYHLALKFYHSSFLGSMLQKGTGTGIVSVMYSNNLL